MHTIVLYSATCHDYKWCVACMWFFDVWICNPCFIHKWNTLCYNMNLIIQYVFIVLNAQMRNNLVFPGTMQLSNYQNYWFLECRVEKFSCRTCIDADIIGGMYTLYEHQFVKIKIVSIVLKCTDEELLSVPGTKQPCNYSYRFLECQVENS